MDSWLKVARAMVVIRHHGNMSPSNDVTVAKVQVLGVIE